MIVAASVALVLVGACVGWWWYRRFFGTEVGRVRLAQGQAFVLSLPPTTGFYTLWLELETGWDPLPSNIPTLVYRPSATLTVSDGSGTTILEGTFERQGAVAYMDHTEESATSHYSRNRKPMLVLPQLGAQAGEVRGTFHVNEPRGFIGASIIATRHGGR